MAKKITYLNKVDTNEAVGNVVEWWRGTDANEVKDVVNSLAVELEGLTTNLGLTLTEQQVQDKIRELSADKTYVDLKIDGLNDKINNVVGWKSQQKQDQEVIVWSSLGDTTDPSTESWSVTFNDLGILYGKAEVLTSKSKDDTYKDREFMPKEAIQELVGVDNTGGHSVFNVTKIQQTGGPMRSTVALNVLATGTRNVYTLVGDERNANGINVAIAGEGVFEMRKVNDVWSDFDIRVNWSERSGGIVGSADYRENSYETTFIISVENNILKITEGVEYLVVRDRPVPYGAPGGKSVKFNSLEFISDANAAEYTLANGVDITAPSNTAGDPDAVSDVRIIEIDNVIPPKYPKGQTQSVGGGEVILPDYGYSFVNFEVTWESPAQNQSIVETDLMAKGTDGSEFIISSQSTPLSNRNGAIIKSNMNYTIVNGVDVASLFLRFKLIEGGWPKLSGIKVAHITK